MEVKIGVVTISDRAYAGIYEDESGPSVIDTLNQIISSEWTPISKLIPDDKIEIENTLINLVDNLSSTEKTIDGFIIVALSKFSLIFISPFILL